MRDSEIYNGFNNLSRLIKFVDDQTKTALAGEMMMQQAMRALLVKKGIFTDDELAAELSNIIEAANKAGAEAKAGLVTPNAEQAAQIDASKTTDIPKAE
jgi:hypothetical protein